MTTLYAYEATATFNWDRLIAHIESYNHAFPNQAWRNESTDIFRDQWGNTALHQACFNKPPVAAINSLLSTEHLSSSLTMKARDGSTPFLIACACEASFEVLHALLCAAADKRKSGSVGSIKYVASEPDLRLNTPLIELWGVFCKTACFKQFRKACEEKRNYSALLESDVFRSFWKKAELTVSAAYFGAVKVKDHDQCEVPSLPLHAFSSVACPPSFDFHRLLQHMYKGTIYNAQSVDENNDLPLHVAARSVNNFISFAYIVGVLIDDFPEAVSVKDKEGKYSLHLAIESGKFWECGGLSAIVGVSPELLMLRDSSSRLYPFMLAGCVGAPSLNTIFELLRTNPSSLQSSYMSSFENGKLCSQSPR
mmetsp:Transcript_26511/g.41126  ORF Transcript_26511/g.41126 Transcript_26511/m.41126 type:complete len:366 (+) Transcript_26511:210-1307(+)